MTNESKYIVKTTQTRNISINLNIRSNEDFTNINEVSPYSNKTEFQRMKELNQQVDKAKIALDAFSEPARISIAIKLKKLLNYY